MFNVQKGKSLSRNPKISPYQHCYLNYIDLEECFLAIIIRTQLRSNNFPVRSHSPQHIDEIHTPTMHSQNDREDIAQRQSRVPSAIRNENKKTAGDRVQISLNI